VLRKLARVLFLLIVFAAGKASARVFSFGNESFAAFVGGGWGKAVTNTLNSSSNSDAANPVTVNSEHPYNLSGEFGFIYTKQGVSLRGSLEVLRPQDLNDVKATTASGSEVYSMTSEISVWVPKIALEITMKQWPTNRMFLEVGTGYASLAARNSYTFTPAGTTAYGGLSDFYEDLRSATPMYEAALGYESLLTDSTTFVLQAGYRRLVFDDIKQNRDVTTFQGPVVKGDPALNTDSSKRSLDLSTYYIGLALRFWLP
jgi:hypothetical protein